MWQQEMVTDGCYAQSVNLATGDCMVQPDYSLYAQTLNLLRFCYNFALRGHMAGAPGLYQAAHSIRMKSLGWERRVKHGKKLELTQNTYSSKCSSQMTMAIGATTH
jgi:hypothetical protein